MQLGTDETNFSAAKLMGSRTSLCLVIHLLQCICSGFAHKAEPWQVHGIGGRKIYKVVLNTTLSRTAFWSREM